MFGLKMVIGTITECVTDAAIKDTLLLTAKVGVMRRGDALTVKLKVTLPEIAQGDQMKD